MSLSLSETNMKLHAVFCKHETSRCLFVSERTIKSIIINIGDAAADAADAI
jgi:hypothetical protein